MFSPALCLSFRSTHLILNCRRSICGIIEPHISTIELFKSTINTLGSTYDLNSHTSLNPYNIVSDSKLSNEFKVDLPPVSPSTSLTFHDSNDFKYHPLTYPIASQNGLTLSLLFDPEALNSSPKVCTTQPGGGFELLSDDLDSYVLRLITYFDLKEPEEEKTIDSINLYNAHQLKQGEPEYVSGEIKKFEKYGHSKYAALRVGPFKDIYERLSIEKYLKKR